MFIVPGDRTRRTWRIGASAAVHAAALISLLHGGQEVRVRQSLPGTALGTRVELTYLPGGESAALANRRQSIAPRMPALRVDPVKAPASRLRLLPAVEASAPPTPQESPKRSMALSSGLSGAATNDALGTDDIQIALTTYSPSPVPDLSQLPHGKQGDVVIDITIDPTGKVADLQILQALGYGVDGKVADTVRTWMFHPATKDGVPVASMQELHFHFGPV